MKVRRHAEVALVALTQDMPVPASVILHHLRRMEAPPTSAALEVCRMTMAIGDRAREQSNGDQVVVIIREGVVVTAMLRRSWGQPFTPEALRVEAVMRWKDA
jgi:hypothetical protein